MACQALSKTHWTTFVHSSEGKTSILVCSDRDNLACDAGMRQDESPEHVGSAGACRQVHSTHANAQFPQQFTGAYTCASPPEMKGPVAR